MLQEQWPLIAPAKWTFLSVVRLAIVVEGCRKWLEREGMILIF